MSPNEINTICANADMIICGYAFTKKEDTNIHVVQLQHPFHALVLSPEGEMQETSMDDVEIAIVMDYWHRNRKYMEESYA